MNQEVFVILLMFRSWFIIDSNDFYESAVTSSLLYAKKNPPIKQSILLSDETDSTTSEANNKPILDEREINPSVVESKPKFLEKKIKPQSLQDFYPEIPPAKEETSIKKKKMKKRTKSGSKTKQLLLEALNDSKQNLQAIIDEKSIKSKKKTKSRLTKKQRKEYELKNTIKLTRFIPQTVRVPKKSINRRITHKSDQNLLLEESDLYPFSTFIEWLIWHNNFPELAYVREAYDLDSVPQDSDEIYWVNVMNEPEFFTSNWKMAGSRIQDLEGARTSGPPGGEPEFNMDLILTENGFSTLFSDVHMILTKLPSGLKNHRYPILQFALKGLQLLELAYTDENLRWFALGSENDLKTRLTKLDSFVGEQESQASYEDNVMTLMDAESWKKGLITFDLLIMKSMFLSTFSRTQISEEIKIKTLIDNKLQHVIIANLNEVNQLDKLRVRNLIRQFSN